LPAILLCLHLLALGALPRPAAPQAQVRPLAYRWTAAQPLRYSLVAHLTGAIPLFDNPEPVQIDGVLTIIYKATPTAVRPDGSAEMTLRVETAEAEMAGIPLPVPEEDAHKVLDQVVRFAKSGAVVSVKPGLPLPFAVSIPGVDPKRLYCLLFPVVFPEHAVAPGDQWPYTSELLGGQGSQASFSGEMVAVKYRPVVSYPASDELKAELPKRLSLPTEITAKTPVFLKSIFSMDVKQSLDAKKKPTTDPAAVKKTRTGVIKGDGGYTFDKARGLVTSGVLILSADITEKTVGEPATPDTPTEMKSAVQAAIYVNLLPPSAKAGTTAKTKAKPTPKRRK
jgi:hypothetical protein